MKLDNQISGQPAQLFLPSLNGQENKPSFPRLDKANFSVKLVPMYVAHPTMANMGVNVPTNIAQAVVDDRTGAVISTAKGQLRLVQNDQLHNAAKDAFKSLIPDTWPVILKEGVSNNGGFSALTYKIPDYSATIEQSNGSTVSLTMQFTIVNAHARAVTAFASFEDGSCGNTVIFTDAKATSPHLDSFTTAPLEQHIKDAMHKAPEYVAMLQKWARKDFEFFEFENLMRTQGHLSPTQRGELLTQFMEEEIPNRGSNLYAALSSLAAWGTHNEGRFYVRNSRNTDNEAESLFARQEKIQRVVGSDAWKAVANG